jgi:hypothetical protein
LDAVLALDPVLNTGANRLLQEVIHNSKVKLVPYQLVYAVFQETWIVLNLATLKVSLELLQEQVKPKKIMPKEKN